MAINRTVVTNRRLVLDYGYCLDFSAANAKVTIASAAALNPTIFSIAAWFKPGALTANDQPIIGKYSTASGKRGFQLTLKASGFVMGSVSFDGNSDTTITGTVPIKPAEWIHVVLTFDGTNLKLYFNSVLNKTTPASGSLVSTTTDFSVNHIFDFAKLS